MNRRPKKDEYAKYYQPYIDKVPKGNILDNLKSVHQETQDFFKNVGEINGNYRYAPGKWTLKEVLIHLIDAEQVFAYRALRFARKDKTPLPGFEENDYVDAVDVSNRTIKDLMKEYRITRDLTLVMFSHFEEWMFEERGTASDNEISVRALAYCILGHEIHHREVIKERYLG